MEFKHFSHTHGLVYHQMPYGTEIQCSGCKSPGTGAVYTCWQCGYFLHEQCFSATRSLKHPSHPLHPLTLVPFPTYPSNSFYCNTCNLAGHGFSYCCSECDFDLHVHCALTTINNHSNFPVTNEMQNLNPQHQNHQFPSFPPNPSIPHDTHNFNSHIPQNTNHPSMPNNTSFATANQPHQFNPNTYPQAPQTTIHQPIPNNHIPTIPEPNPTVPTFNPSVNATSTNTPPASTPQPVNIQPPQTSKPQATPKVIKHFSHPHILQPMEMKEKNQKFCSACEQYLVGSVYCCIEPNCKFNLHKTCFESPLEVRHKCHLDHPLTLITAPPYDEGFTCNACIKDGKAFAYTCKTCSYDLHIDCISWPDTVKRTDHKHPLTLYYSSPFANAGGQGNQQVTNTCDVCKNPVHELAWFYYCRECDFGTHLECVTIATKQDPSAAKTEEELLTETELKLAVLQLLMSGGLKVEIQ